MNTTAPIAANVLPFAGFVFINPWATCYTARKKITPADLGLRPQDLPPATLASLGSMHSADPKKLSVFESHRGAMRNACVEFGTRAMGGFAVPEGKAAYTAAKLDEIVESFYEAKRKFLADFEMEREAWLRRPEFAPWTDKIRARLDPIQHVDKQLQCGWEAFVIAPTTELPKAPGEAESPLAVGVHRVAAGIGDQALQEVAANAEALIRDSFHDDQGRPRSEVTQKILSPIRRMLDKLDAMSFADPRLMHVVHYGKSELAQLPVKGKMSNNDLARVYSLVQALSDPDAILKVAVFAASSSMEVSGDESQVLLDIAAPAASAPQVDSTPVEDDVGAVDVSAVVQDASAPAESLSTEPSEAPSQEVVYDDCF